MSVRVSTIVMHTAMPHAQVEAAMEERLAALQLSVDVQTDLLRRALSARTTHLVVIVFAVTVARDRRRHGLQ